MTKNTNDKNHERIKIGEIAYFDKQPGAFAKVELLFAECTPELDKEQKEFLRIASDTFIADLSAYCATKEQTQENYHGNK